MNHLTFSKEYLTNIHTLLASTSPFPEIKTQLPTLRFCPSVPYRRTASIWVFPLPSEIASPSTHHGSKFLAPAVVAPDHSTPGYQEPCKSSPHRKIGNPSFGFGSCNTRSSNIAASEPRSRDHPVADSFSDQILHEAYPHLMNWMCWYL